MLRLLASAIVLLSVFHSPLVNAESATVSVGVGDTILTINGQTSPNAFVTFTDNGSIIGTTSADASGSFSKTFPAFIHGVHHISTYARDQSNRLTDTITTEVNVVEHLETTLTLFLPPTLAISEPSVTQGNPIELRGATAPGATVTVTIDSVATFQVTAGADGEWTQQIPTNNFSVDQHRLYAAATQTGGNQSYPTAIYSFNILAPPSKPPGQQPIIPPVLSPKPQPPTITYPTNGQKVADKELTITGTAQPGLRIELYNSGRLIGATFADQNGNWRLTITLSQPIYEIQAKACKVDICSDFSKKITFYYQTAIGNFYAYLDAYSFTWPVREPLSLRLHIRGGITPYTTTIDWGDGTVERIQPSQSDTYPTHTYNQAGSYIGSIVVNDKNDNRFVLAFATQITGHTRISLFQIVIIILIIIILAIAWLLHRKRQRNRHHDTTTNSQA